MAQQLSAGRTRTEIEAELAEVRRFASLAALAMFGDANQDSRVLSRLNGLGRVFADTFQALNRGAHQPYTGDLRQLISETSRLITKLREIMQ